MAFRRTNPTGPFEDLNQARARLSSGVFTFDGEPISVRTVEPHSDGVLRVFFDYLGHNGEPPAGRAGVRKMINSPSFNRFKPFDLGFINMNESRFGEAAENRALFSARRPVRMSRSGLTGENFVAKALYGSLNREGRSQTEGIDFSHIVNTRSFCDMVRGRYPSFSECFDYVRSNRAAGSSMAFDRKWALSREDSGLIWLYRDSEKVGLMSERGLILLNAQRHFQEDISENSSIPPIVMEI